MFASFQIGQTEFHLAVQSTGTDQSRIEYIGSIGRHENLNVAARFKAIELGTNLQHGPLHFIVAALFVDVTTRPSNSVDLIKEDDTGGLGPGNLEKFADHASTFTNVLFHQLTANDADKASIGAIGDGAGGQCLARSGWSVEQAHPWEGRYRVVQIVQDAVMATP